MGPDATVDFMARVISATPASQDQDHIPMIVDHNPQVPNRQEALLRGGEDPGPVMASMARRLEAAGADFLVIPCNSAFAFRDAVEEAVSIPLVSIVDETSDACAEYGAVGLLATDGCLSSQLYQDALAHRGVTVVLPETDELAELMRLISAIKAGDKSSEVVASMRSLADGLAGRGAQAIVAGCTEVPLVLDDSMLEVPVISSTELLARATVRHALA
jgi:aspartate racemase